MKLYLHCLILFLLCLPSVDYAAVLPKEVAGKRLPSLAPMIEKVMPSIVNIAAVGELSDAEARIRSQLQQQKQQPLQPHAESKDNKFATIGSGVILDSANGYIITNAHLLEKTNRVVVTLNDGRQFVAKMIGQDAASDIAVLQIKAPRLVAMTLGDSDKIKVGDFVTAIGSPFGLSKTVTSGIISAMGRSRLGIEGYEDFIQTDAAINVGNSGGALIDLSGRLVGINTAILSPANIGSVGIGFAIPINMAQSVMQQLVRYGEVKRGLMGVYVQKITPDLAQDFAMSNTDGALVAFIAPGSPAAKAGIMPGDIITHIDGRLVRDAAQVRNVVGLHRVGSAVKLELLRHNKPKSYTISLADPNTHNSLVLVSNPLFAGLGLHDFKAQTVAHGMLEGVVVTQITENSAGWRAGLVPGDVIININQQTVTELNGLNRAASRLAQQEQNHLLLRVIRGSGALFVALREEP